MVRKYSDCYYCGGAVEEKLMPRESLDEMMKKYQPYLGALEIDDTSRLHWRLYSDFLVPKYRILNRDLNIFWDGIIEDSKDEDEGWAKELEEIGFRKVSFESLNLRYSIFDKYDNYNHACRVAEWRKYAGALLAFIADDVVCRLSDIAPDLGNKLLTALTTFETAETNEHLAQVTTTCRRIVEYIADKLLPPSDEKHKGHSLGHGDYRNRLLAFADRERQSNTNIDLITASTNALNEQWERLSNLANKGVHGEVYRAETRRCLLRTILLLDDLISLKTGAFEIKPDLDFDEIVNLVRSDSE